MKKECSSNINVLYDDEILISGELLDEVIPNLEVYSDYKINSLDILKIIKCMEVTRMNEFVGGERK
ncbi:hypothetical protein CCS79_08885 [Clostridium diolis]|uniref:hypothetical protein n=1 Tax=Clostridium diolis TaxID=223919 RepID=UPI000B3F7A6C|nr:hypothetical protein [Clostridium diolis]OVE69031.1 hypothetical protein CCS79_08885 [Clostridium diolis]